MNMADAAPEKTTTQRLEEEGEIAADYLEELLDIADLDGEIDMDIDHGRATVDIVTEARGSLSHLVGGEGEVLDALQDLTRLAVQARTGEPRRTSGGAHCAGERGDGDGTVLGRGDRA